MASTTMVASPSDDRFRMNTLPIIDLRLLSQSELYCLSRFSSSSSSSISQSNNDDDVLIPKIDRSVFNESAGSRKQTYSRLRLAPRKSQFPSSSSSSTIRPQSPDRFDEESAEIVTLFKQLFVGESHCGVNDSYDDGDEDLVLVNHIYDESVPESSYAIFHSIPVDIIDSSYAPIKRRRGRPRKDSNRFAQSNGNAAANSISGCDKRAEEDEIVMDLSALED
ncbi:methyl-CpG-binding domain-containing protein 8-like isoform X1 [Cucurbita moschata]|uniref:Methyl-CpG-binding domain-containing protein 8-like isoform X1 n=1 Tax=Cucurbita moschata TaxID=3662 RepID=A0A6J1GJ84_CUCMO|nr:methyl-CpG-binding domain-containing protein 8-like isoform X1 [Cucurbita moschata]